ncbi:hypothetical protein ACTFIW_002799 [Dictyostelium discoideum]
MIRISRFASPNDVPYIVIKAVVFVMVGGVFHSDEPFSRLWVCVYSRVCASPEEDCSYRISAMKKIPLPYNLKYSKKPKTSGEDIIITGTYLRFMGGPNSLLNTITFQIIYPFVVKGHGNFKLAYDDLGKNRFQFSYESPKISSIVPDSLKQMITINGDNFFTDKDLVRVSFDGINQPNFIISLNHTQIQVNDFNRVDPGPISVNITVDGISIEKNYVHYFPVILTSISSVSNHLGGIVTIKGEKLSSTLNSSVTPSITIGDNQLDFNFGGCNSTSPNGVSFTYNIPTLSSESYLNGIVTLIGTNLGTNEESFIQLYGDGINDNINIDQFNVS